MSAVQDTRIFARRTMEGRQYLVYRMTYQSGTGIARRQQEFQSATAVLDVAMILPLPTPPASLENAVRFVNLSGYEEFFADLDRGFPSPPTIREPYYPDVLRGSLGIESPLVVYDVGSYEASFVPTLGDFERLDGRFRLPKTIWNQLPQYRDYGFAVFKLKAGARTMQPMAFDFPLRSSFRLFFPTIHIHAGRVDPSARFDHTLYCQGLDGVKGWDVSFQLPPISQSPVPDLNKWVSPEIRRKNAFYERERFSETLRTERRDHFDLLRLGWEEDCIRLYDWFNLQRADPRNHLNARDFVAVERAAGIIDLALPVQRRRFLGDHPNQDVTF